MRYDLQIVVAANQYMRKYYLTIQNGCLDICVDREKLKVSIMVRKKISVELPEQTRNNIRNHNMGQYFEHLKDDPKVSHVANMLEISNFAILFKSKFPYMEDAKTHFLTHPSSIPPILLADWLMFPVDSFPVYGDQEK